MHNVGNRLQRLRVGDVGEVVLLVNAADCGWNFLQRPAVSKTRLGENYQRVTGRYEERDECDRQAKWMVGDSSQAVPSHAYEAGLRLSFF